MQPRERMQTRGVGNGKAIAESMLPVREAISGVKGEALLRNLDDLLPGSG